MQINRSRTSPIGLGLTGLSLLFLAACGGGGSSGGGGNSSGGGSSSTSVQTSLGPVSNGAVVAFKADQIDPSKDLKNQKSAAIGSVKTDDDGIAADINLGSYNGLVLYTLVVDSESKYYDEKVVSEVTPKPDKAFTRPKYKPAAFAGSRKGGTPKALMFALAPASRSTVALTPLTTLGYTLSERNDIFADADPAAVASRANKAIGNALAPELNNIMTPPAIFDSSTSTGSLKANQAGKYALRLAALAKVGSNSSSQPALETLSVLALDLNDGAINSSNPAYNNLSDFKSQLKSALLNVAQNYASNGQAAVSNYPPVTANVDYEYANAGSNKTVTTSGKVKADYDSSTHKAGDSVSGGEIEVVEYAPGEAISFSASNRKDNSAFTLTFPISQTDNAKCPTDGEATLSVTKPTGSSSATGPDRIYTTTVTAGGSSCDVIINTNGGKGGQLKGTFNGDFDQLTAPGTNTFNLTNGSFEITLPNQTVSWSDSGNGSGGGSGGGSGMCGSAPNCATAKINGTRVTYANPDKPILVINNNNRILFDLDNNAVGYSFGFPKPISKGQTFDCSSTPGSLLLVQDILRSKGGDAYRATGIGSGSPPGSSCAAKITKNTGSGGVLKGTFNGTWVDSSGNSVNVTNGEFKVQLP